MAITPFTEPVRQPEFIPARERLPVQQLGESALSIYQQDVKNRDRLSSIQEELATQQVSDKDRQAFNQLVDRYREEMRGMTEDELLFGDRQKISRLARDFKKNIGVLQQAQERRKQQQKAIEEATSDQQRRRLMQQAAADTGIAYRDGQLDPQSVPSVQSFGEEAENLYDVGVSAIEGLKEEMIRSKDGQAQRGFGRVYEGMGVAEFVEQSGVSPERIKNVVESEFRENTKVQNWKANTEQAYSQILQRRGLSEEEAQSRAQRIANNRVNQVVQDVANQRSYSQMDISLEDIPDPEGSGDSEEAGKQKEIMTQGAPMSTSSLSSGAQKKEAQERESNIRQSVMNDTLTDEEQRRIEQLRAEATIESQPQFQQSLSGDGLGRALGPRDISLSADAIFERKMKKEGLWEVYQSAEEKAQSKINSPEHSPQFFGMSGTQSKIDQKRKQIVDNALLPNIEKIESNDVYTQTDGRWYQLWTQTNRSDVKQNLRAVAANARDIQISDDARWLRVVTNSTIKEGDEQFANRTFRISTENLSESTINALTQEFSNDVQKTINSNAKYRNYAITEDQPLDIKRGDNTVARVRKEGKTRNGEYTENYKVRVPEESGGMRDATYEDVINNTQDVNTAVREILMAANKRNLTAIQNVNDIKNAYKEYKKLKEGTLSISDLGAPAKQLHQLLNDSVRLNHRGSAVEFGQRIAQ